MAEPNLAGFDPWNIPGYTGPGGMPKLGEGPSGGDTNSQPSPEGAPGKNNMPADAQWGTHNGIDPSTFMQGEASLPIGANGLRPNEFAVNSVQNQGGGYAGNLPAGTPPDAKWSAAGPAIPTFTATPPAQPIFPSLPLSNTTLQWNQMDALFQNRQQIMNKISPYSNQPIYGTIA